MSDWLESLGMSEYVQRFAENDIDTAVLRHLTMLDEPNCEVISAYQKCVAETVQRFGGFVTKYMGDGLEGTW